MVTRRYFIGLLGLLALQRWLELRYSKRNEIRILRKGGAEHAPEHFQLMKLLHLSWFLAMVGEVFFLKRPFQPALAGIAFLTAAIGQSLRYASIKALGPRWTVRILTLPNSPPVKDGIYRYISHPNYLGVTLEILAIPLLHTAYLTSIFGSIVNALVLSIRIREEEKALRENIISAYFPCKQSNSFARIFDKPI